MAGNKKINSDLEVLGKGLIHTVPNATGTVMTYNTTSKELSTRTNAEIISDLGLITATNIAAAYYTKTQLQTSGQASVNWGNLTNIPVGLVSNSHSHSNKAFLDTVDQNLGTTHTPTFSTVKTSRSGIIGTYNASQTQAVWSMDNSYTVNTTLTGLGTLYGIGYSYISVGGSSLASKHQIHFAESGIAKASINLTDGEIRANRFTSLIPTGTAPFTVTSTTVVPNLNADLLDGLHSTSFMQTSHAANAITSTNITNWNTAVSWGNHAGLYSLIGHNHDGVYYTKTQLQTSGQASVNWGNLTSVPTTFPATAHTHPISQVTDLQTTLKGLTPVQSTRDFPDGTLITTSIDYSQPEGNAWLLEITGNTYGASSPLNVQVQGYIYSNSIISYSGISNTPMITSIIAKNLNGKLCFWLPRFSYWQGYTAICRDVTSVNPANRVESITNAVDVLGTKRVTIPINILAERNWVTNNFISNTHVVNAITAANITNWNTAVGWGNHAGLYAPTNHSHTFASITSKPTTLSGYGITDSIKITSTSLLNNYSGVGSTYVPASSNSTWFDYNWASTGKGGSVISFGGFGSYTTEIFSNYNGGEYIGFRTRNGDANTWNPIREIWHNGNFNPSLKVDVLQNANGLGFSSGVLPTTSGTEYPYIRYAPTGNLVALSTKDYSDNKFAQKWENATAIGFSSGVLPTTDGSQYPYIYHTSAGYIPLATQLFTNTNFLRKHNNNVSVYGTSFTTKVDHANGTKIVLPHLVNSQKMMMFTVRVYQSYNYYDIVFSGYLYPAVNNWYIPQADLSVGNTAIRVKMGRNTDNRAYVWVDAGQYTGIAILNIITGYEGGDSSAGWDIIATGDTPNVVLDTIIQPNVKTNDGRLHSHSNLSNLNSINQNLGTTSAPTFSGLYSSSFASLYGNPQVMNFNGDRIYLGNPLLPQIYIETSNLASGVSINGNRVWHAGNLDLSTYYQTLGITTEGEGGQNLSLSNGNTVSLTNFFITSRDGNRGLENILPNGNGRRVRFDFAAAGAQLLGGTGNYAGVMTYCPWDGTAASTGDSSYQLAFINETGINGSGNPGLRLRKGIDTTWGSWVSVLTAHNGVTLNTAQTISGVKTFTNSVTAPDFIGTSDITLKENIALYETKELETEYKEFNFKDNDQVRVGLIAQELQKDHPEFVRKNEDGILAISYNDLHSAEIAYLKYENKKLKEEVELIKKALKL